MQDHSKRLSWLRDRPIAHRGKADAAMLENTLAAFSGCVAGGTPIELDVHLSRDGVPVVIHDFHLGRLCGADVTVEALSVAQLQALPLLGTEARIPTLGEVLRLVAGRVPVLIEIKARGRSRELEAATWRELADYGGPYAVQSFDPGAILWFRRHAPQVLRGQLVSDEADDQVYRGRAWRLAMRALLPNLLTRPDFVAVKLSMLTPRYARYVKARAGCVLGWTVRGEADWQLCAARGVNVIYEGPRVAAG